MLPLMRVLCGCGASFMRSGIRNHQQRSDDPLCNQPFGVPAQKPKDSEFDDQVGKEVEDERLSGDMPDNFEVHPNGDFFGDYDDYSAEDFGLDPEEDDYENSDDGDNDDDRDGVNFETYLEPDQSPDQARSCPSDEVEASGGDAQGAYRLRGGAEVELKKKPVVVKFRKGKAGAVYATHRNMDENSSYTSKIGNPDNPFSPFSSKLDWEIAHWAKTRGPSSTAFTELMSIEGVRR